VFLVLEESLIEDRFIKTKLWLRTIIQAVLNTPFESEKLFKK